MRSGGKLSVETDNVTLQNATVAAGYKGACIYLEEGATMYIKGNPTFSNNMISVDFSSATNGGEAYPDSGAKAQQDIYINGYTYRTAESLVVTGNLTGAEGSIYVWASDMPHYRQGNQFAVFASDVDTDTVKVFRNARTDGDTANTTNGYLRGTTKNDGKIYWNGTYTFSVTKTVSGAVTPDAFNFRITGVSSAMTYRLYEYNDNGSTWTAKTGLGATGTLSAFTMEDANTVIVPLHHGERIDIDIPEDTDVTVAEKNPGSRYKVSYVATDGIVHPVTYTMPDEYQGTGAITLNQDISVDFTNSSGIVAPTLVSTTRNKIPFAAVMTAGLLVVPFVVGRRRKKDEEESV